MNILFRKKIKYIVVIIFVLILNFTLAQADEDVLTEQIEDNELLFETEIDFNIDEAESDEEVAQDEDISNSVEEQDVEDALQNISDIEINEEIGISSSTVVKDFEFDSIVQEDDEYSVTSTSSSLTESLIIPYTNPTSSELIANDADSDISTSSYNVSELNEINRKIADKSEFSFNKRPEIIAQWQMISNSTTSGAYTGEDDSNEIGVQILPSGKFEVSKQYVACAIILNLSDENKVLTTVYYPKDIAYDENFKRGCGEKQSEFKMEKISNVKAFDLVCGKIRADNNNLILWVKGENNRMNDFEMLCKDDGAKFQNNFSLFCGESSLAYDDPAGDYTVTVSLEDDYVGYSETQNTLKYLELTVIENDFLDFQYGKVHQNDLKIIEGDTVWGSSTHPTVRNVGNTRMQIKIWQDDFGLGKTDNIWNIEYRTRIGKNMEFVNYYPEQSISLLEPLNLGQKVNIDFAVLVNNFSEKNKKQYSFFGEMILSAGTADNFLCQY